MLLTYGVGCYTSWIWFGHFPPPPYPNVEGNPPHVCWGIWKERNNRDFRNEERSEEIVIDIICKLLVENMKSRKWRKPYPPQIDGKNDSLKLES